jgi:membrane associated rhomboid family serine protease
VAQAVNVHIWLDRARKKGGKRPRQEEIGARYAVRAMFPYRDENQTQRTPYVTILIIALNVLVWLVVERAGAPLALARAVCDLGLIPGELTGMLAPGARFPMGDGLVCITDPGRQVSHIFTSMFLHGSWMHLIGNMWFLWVFGDNIEDSMGSVRFAIFYLISGIAAALLQVVLNPASGIPMVGASGAISGVMGAYLILYPRVRVFCLVLLGFLFTSIALPAWTMLLYWAAIQLVSGLFGLFAQERGGVAFWAHVGGFVAGVLLIKLFARPDDVMAHRSHHWEPRRLVGR